MRLVRLAELPRESLSGALFPGAPVLKSAVLAASDSAQLSFTLLTFGPESGNAFHTHTHDQVLLAVEGTGVVATATASMEFGPGEVVLVPAGEDHWHAAAPGRHCAMLSITPQGTATTVS
jgi:quercetin dioxygenase-like cupin family protein